MEDVKKSLSIVVTSSAEFARTMSGTVRLFTGKEGVFVLFDNMLPQDAGKFVAAMQEEYAGNNVNFWMETS